MDLKYDNCPHCFSKKNEGTQCSVCGYKYAMINSQPDNVLPVFTQLNNRYLIGHCIGKGGFGITYSALDLETNIRCAIKEFYPSEFAVRNKATNGVYPNQKKEAPVVFDHAKLKFLEEARLLYQLRNTPNIVRLFNYFSENNTAYIVMEFLDGCDLRKYARQCGGRIQLNMAVDILDACASALAEVHSKGFLHRDISPDNIFVRKQPVNGQSAYVLIDFGAARNFIGNNAQTVLLKPGFAPPEAYSKTGIKGPWTDVFSLAASIYNVLSGQTIIDALYRIRGNKQPSLLDLGINVPPMFSKVIEDAMQLNYKQRPQSMIEFRNLVLSSVHKTHQSSQQSFHEQVVHTAKCRGIITILDGSKRGVTATIEDGQTIKIGRSMIQSDFVLDYISEISRIHCTLSFNARERLFYLTDMSANGTFFDTNERLLKERVYKIPSGQKFFLVRRDCMLMVKIEEEG